MAKQLASNALTIYSDGSSLPGRRGGVGFVLIWEDEDGHEVRDEGWTPGWAGATNNQMEIQACIEALKLALGKGSPVDFSGLSKIDILTDSMYVVDNFNSALFTWPKTKWTLRDGAPVANTSQWKELAKLVKRASDRGFRVRPAWVKGHKRDADNKRADALAKKSARTRTSRTMTPAKLRRKKSPHRVKVGNVPMNGQEATIRIVTDEYLASHRCYRYIYEIVDEDGDVTTPPDKIHSNSMLEAGHVYEVRFNDHQKNPQIEQVIGEILQPNEEHEAESNEAPPEES